MATKNYMINDKWLDLDKQNIVELQSVDGVLDSLKVNGSEVVDPSGKITITENGSDIDIAQYALADVNVPLPAGKITITENGTDIDIAQYALADVSVEGGGGSSDFSTAEVTFICSDDEIDIPLAFPVTTEVGLDIAYMVAPDMTLEIPLYQGACLVMGNASYEGDYTDFSATGDITIDTVNRVIIVSGNGTITYTPAP